MLFSLSPPGRAPDPTRPLAPGALPVLPEPGFAALRARSLPRRRPPHTAPAIRRPAVLAAKGET